MLPIEKKLEITHENSLIVTLSLSSDLTWFAGHFDSQPILPGVAQIEWAMNYTQRYLNPKARFATLEQIKFLAPILPFDDIQLHLQWNQQKNEISFKYFICSEKVEPMKMSIGKIRLCQQL